MNGPRNTEPQANYELARALRRRNPDWTDETVHAERTNVIRQGVFGSGTGKKPDILVSSPRRQAVIVETEFAPAHTVEQDAIARLGASLQSTGSEIEGVLSVVLPQSLRTGDLEAIEGAAFRYAVHYLDAEGKPCAGPRSGSGWKEAWTILRMPLSICLFLNGNWRGGPKLSNGLCEMRRPCWLSTREKAL